MKSLGLTRYALVIGTAAAMLAGCGGSQPPIGAPGAMAQAPAEAHADRGKSWMLPEAKSENLLYVWNTNSDQGVYVFSYPRGKLVGTLTGFFGIYGECVDRTGDVWITNSSPPEIIEYAHGGTYPTATLSDAGEEPGGCSIDPTTGDLAVANYYPGNVAIYQDAQGTPIMYSDPDISGYIHCAYDSNGNLFADGGADGIGIIAELPKGASGMETVTLSEDIIPFSMQWDGTYLATVALDYHPPRDDGGVTRGPVLVDRVSVYGSSGTVVSTTQLKSPRDRNSSYGQYTIDGGTIVGPDRYGHAGDRLPILFWHYPGGGKPFKVIRGTWSAGGAVVSAAPK
jgi:hypothetical protein